jgi:hypothetical protein
MKIRCHRLFALAAIACATFCLPLAAQTSASVNRIVAPIDEANLVTLHGNVHPLAQARFDRGPAPLSTPTGRIVLLLQRSTAQQQALTQYLADVQNPSSPSFHKWLTPAQYGAQFGISDSDLQTVETWLHVHGFKIEKVPQARNLVQFSGNFEQLQSAFHTSIHTLAVNGESHFANIADPKIPASLVPVVAGVGPLNDFHPKPNFIMGPRGSYDPSTHSIKPALTLFNGSTPLLFVDPADAATIYDTPNTNLNANYNSGTTWDGTGVKIGIAGDSDVNTTDVGNYRIAFLNQATTSSNIPTVIVDGTDPGFNGDEIEALLDNEVAGGLAPGASLYFYTSANSDLSAGLFNSIFRALDDNTVSILNISFGGCEAAQGTAGNLTILEGAEQAAAQGISVTVSTGDSGSAGCDNADFESAATLGFGVNGFASTPYTIAVGGTDYDVLATSFATYVTDSNSGASPYWGTALSYIPEEPWNDSTSANGLLAANTPLTLNGQTLIAAGGGGESSIYAKPAFQSSLTSSFTNRDLPDVSLLAANGLYGATWVVCGDSQADGAPPSDQTSYDCATTGGQFTNASTFLGVGGTSASAPAFAGMLALVSQSQGGARLGQADDVLYLLAKSNYSSVFHDVTTGNNSVICIAGSPNCGSNEFLTGYNAVSGYDLASGLGSVDVKQMITDWASAKLGSTSTTLQINGSTAAYSGTHGAALTFGVGVNPGKATGVVGIIAAANENADGPLNNGQFAIPLTGGTGSASYNGLPGGRYTVAARYGGDAANAASTSSPIQIDIASEASTTTLSINAYNPLTGASIPTTNIPYGSTVFVDATITGTAEGSKSQGVATGTVLFCCEDVNDSVQKAVADNGVASFLYIDNPGTYTWNSSYSGDASFNPSTSNPASLTIVKAGTTTAASASPSSIAASGSTTVTVAVATPLNRGGAPSGTVTLAAGGTTLATIPGLTLSLQISGSTIEYVETGTTTLSGSQLSLGSNAITATYSGDQDYVSSSTTFSLTTTAPSPAIALSNGGNITVNAGATTGNTSTITVTPSNGYAGTVNLTCAVTTGITNPNDPPTCSLPSSVTISGATAAAATLTVTTTATNTSALALPLEKFFLGGGATLAMILLFGIPARRRAWRALPSIFAIVFTVGAVGCGGGGGGGTHTIQGTTAGTYTVTVTGKDASTGSITASTTVTVAVN